MGVVVQNVSGVLDFDARQKLFGLIGGIALAARRMGLDSFADLVTDGEDRVEGGHRVLKNHDSGTAAQAC
ncbi:MAG: hypothetical protein MO846_09045 [Candidatus Devosia symbiotica]|nr:hypothetical protein [Candidatus Devosia symbiotica]